MRKENRTDDIYDVEAESYDLLFSDFVDDTELVLKIAEQTGGPILELMCGTGRVLLPLAKEGYEVWGLDSHDAMVQRAKTKLSRENKELRSKVHLVKGDARSFSLALRFPLIILTFNSFLHLHRTEDQDACLKSVAKHLQSEGLFLVAIWNPDLTRKDGPLKLSKILRVGPGNEMVWMESESLSPSSKSGDTYYVYDLLRPKGDVRRRLGRTTFRLVFRVEMESLLERCGLRVERLLGGYDGRPFEEHSPMQIYVCPRADAKV